MKWVGNGRWELIVAAILFISFSMICFCYLLVLLLLLSTALFIALPDAFQCLSFSAENTFWTAADFRNIIYTSIYADN